MRVRYWFRFHLGQYGCSWNYSGLVRWEEIGGAMGRWAVVVTRDLHGFLLRVFIWLTGLCEDGRDPWALAALCLLLLAEWLLLLAAWLLLLAA